MKNIILETIIILSAMLLLNKISTAQQKPSLTFRHYSVSDGLSNNTVYSILQDNLGLIWVATDDGLNAFDGYQFYKYKYNPSDSFSISNSIVRCLYEDSQHLIWVGTDDGLNCFNPMSGKFTHYKSDAKNKFTISNNLITCITEDAGGTIWIGTYGGGLNSFNKKTNHFTHFFNSNNNLSDKGSFISAIATDIKSNKLWVGSSFHGLRLFDPLTGISVSYLNNSADENTISENSITSLCFDKSGTLWIGTLNEGLNQFSLESGKFKRYKHDAANINSLSQNSVFDIYDDKDGNLWIATLGGGINILNQIENKFYSWQSEVSNANSLSSNNVWSVFIDKAGTVWIGTSNGINTYDKNRLKFSTTQIDNNSNQQFANNNVYSIFEDSQKNLWIGILGGGLYEYDLNSKNIIASYKSAAANENSISSNNVLCITEDNNGKLWIGSYDGLNCFDKEKKQFTVYKNNPADENSLSNNNITSLLATSDGELLIGTYGGGLNSFDQTTGKFFRFNHSIKNKSEAINNISCIFEDTKKTIWIGTFGDGLCQLNSSTSTFTSFKNNSLDKNSISSNFVYSIAEDLNGVLWIGTYGAGLNAMTDKGKNNFIRYNESNGFPNNIITGISTDAKNSLWLSTNNGIVEFTIDSKNIASSVPLIRFYDERDGLQYKYNNGAVFKSADGNFYFGGLNGFNAFNPENIINNPNKPPVVITRFKVFDKEYLLDSLISQKKIIELSYTQNFFSFEFAGLNYAFSEKNKYAYQLEGFDKEWIESGNRRYVAYTNLDEGTYTFKVKSANNDGVWNDDGTSITIIIHPPFWKTWWFYLICITAFLISIYLFIKIRTRNLVTKNKWMERSVQLRTKELQLQKEKTEEKTIEIENALVNLKATQKQLIQQEKLASLGQLTAGIAHEIKNPLNFVNNFSSLSVELAEEIKESKSEEERNELLSDLVINLEKINHHGKRADSIVRSMLEHSRSGSEEKHQTNINRLGEEYLNLAFHGMRSTLRDFNCKLETSFAADLPLISVIPQDISRVLLNLFNNAFYALYEKQKQQSDFQPVLSVATELKNNLIVIHIKDNGSGIPDGIKEKIFEPFFTTKPTGKGTGLGLSLSYDIVKAHGGNIILESKEGIGTEFIISLSVVTMK